MLQATGYIGIYTAASAWYISFAELLNEVWFRGRVGSHLSLACTFAQICHCHAVVTAVHAVAKSACDEAQQKASCSQGEGSCCQMSFCDYPDLQCRGCTRSTFLTAQLLHHITASVSR